MSGKQTKYEYSIKILGEVLYQEEKGLAHWKDIIDNPDSEPLSLRQAKGNISSNEYRVEELKRAIEVLSPASQPTPEKKSE